MTAEVPTPSSPPPTSRLRGTLVERSTSESGAIVDEVAPEVGAEAVFAATSELVGLADEQTGASDRASRVRSTVGTGKQNSTRNDEIPAGPSRIISTVGRQVGDTGRAPKDTVDVTSETHLPTFSTLRPEANVAKTYCDKEGAIDLRLSSTEHHQDGLAYNPDTDTVVVCDGLGGVGASGEVKDFFAFALSHATAELDDISTLADERVVGRLVERAKEILNSMGIEIRPSGSRLVRNNVGAGFEWASTIAAVQRVGDSSTWRIATLGDSSVAILGVDGKVRAGFGEAFQQIRAGNVSSDGTAVEATMGSLVGIEKSLEGGVRYQKNDFGAEFTEVELAEGERLVVVSDAYVQKSNLKVLERDASLTAEDWGAARPTYADDTTMAIVY
ncbi:hypothetical protein KC973_00580 [Candidatus Saccharibacteria bacterium]|nr:hypothetical protein [Candidatus Saccharibacteria bacterium]